MIPDQFRYSLELSFWRTQVRAISVQRMYLLHSLSVFFFSFFPLNSFGTPKMPLYSHRLDLTLADNSHERLPADCLQPSASYLATHPASIVRFQYVVGSQRSVFPFEINTYVIFSEPEAYSGGTLSGKMIGYSCYVFSRYGYFR